MKKYKKIKRKLYKYKVYYFAYSKETTGWSKKRGFIPDSKDRIFYIKEFTKKETYYIEK